ncbi:MAG: tRNA threonylcarbamoyladenosine dehydratase [Clostridiales bacterium]|nr:tRNA threonylcarbamoyladenosine dehydratase [Clostridiales bacterium]
MALKYFSRSAMLLGEENLDILSEKHVLIFGLGGVGSYTAEALARSGIGNITVVDSDTVSETNINRQLYALSSTVGKYKTDVAAERIKDIDPDCVVTKINKFYLPENGDEFFDTHYDYIADAIDTVSAKLDIAVRAKEKNIPLISSMGTGNKLDPTLFRVSDIYETSVCPLCRVMRRELKARGVDALKVVWSPEPPIKPFETDEKTEKRSLPGSVPFVPPVAGILMAREIVLDLIKTGGNARKEQF